MRVIDATCFSNMSTLDPSTLGAQVQRRFELLSSLGVAILDIKERVIGVMICEIGMGMEDTGSPPLSKIL